MTIADLVGRSAGRLAVLFTGTFVAGVGVAFSSIRPTRIALGIFALALFGPPLALAYERGNSDLFVIGVLCIGASLTASRNRYLYALGVALVGAIGVLKLYPIVALAVLLVLALAEPTRRRSRVTTVLALSGLCAALLLMQLDDLRLVSSVTPRPDTYAYGFASVSAFIHNRGLSALLQGGALYFVAVPVALTIVLVVPLLRRFPFRSLPSFSEAGRDFASSRPALLSLIGTVVFVATLPLANYAYRLMMLVLLMPLCASSIDADSRLRRVCGVSLLSAIVALWVAVPLEPNLAGVALGATTLAAAALCVAVVVTNAFVLLAFLGTQAPQAPILAMASPDAMAP